MPLVRILAFAIISAPHLVRTHLQRRLAPHLVAGSPASVLCNFSTPLQMLSFASIALQQWESKHSGTGEFRLS